MAACPYMPRPDETDEGQCQYRRAGTRPTAPETCAAGFELPGCPNGGATSGLPQDSRRNCCNAEVGTYVPQPDQMTTCYGARPCNSATLNNVLRR
jgi:hypothetical protein